MPFLSAAISEGILSARPAAGHAGYVYFATDTKQTFRDNGTTWIDETNSNASNLTSGTLPAARLPNPSASTLGGVQSISSVSHQFLTSISTSGVPSQAALVAADIPNIAESQVTNLTTDLAAKAPLASPTFTGTPAAPTPSPSDNSTKLATTAYVDSAVAGSGGGTVTHASGALTLDLPVLGNGGADVKAGTKTGTGDVVFATSPTLVTPALGTPASGNLSNCTGYPTTITQNSKSAAYTTVLADAGGHIYHPSADTTARTWTIDSNANVAYPIGTALTFVNDSSAGAITIAITSDTLVLAGAGTTGSRTLAANGVATAIKVTSTRWLINGTGLS